MLNPYIFRSIQRSNKFNPAFLYKNLEKKTLCNAYFMLGKSVAKEQFFMKM